MKHDEVGWFSLRRVYLEGAKEQDEALFETRCLIITACMALPGAVFCMFIRKSE